ncbi:MAG: DUF4252 domain-containing protein [Lewinellaceae bacterium]|nr:DUF4252 domain-containing protein [Lewinellaceae bacterium]
MKQLLVCLILTLSGASLSAQDYAMYWKYKDYDGAVAVTAPRWAIHIGSWFLGEKTDRKMLRKVRKARVLVFEGGNLPVSEYDMQRFYHKAKQRNLEELLSVRSADTRVLVLAKERRRALRKIVVLVREPETFALITLRGKLRYEDIGKLLERIPKEKQQKEGEEEGRPLLPDGVRSVIRI